MLELESFITDCHVMYYKIIPISRYHLFSVFFICCICSFMDQRIWGGIAWNEKCVYQISWHRAVIYSCIKLDIWSVNRFIQILLIIPTKCFNCSNINFRGPRINTEVILKARYKNSSACGCFHICCFICIVGIWCYFSFTLW